jgi:hypothetical protein
MVLTSKEILTRELDVLSRNGLLEGFDLQASSDYASSNFQQVNTDEFCLLLLESFDTKLVQNLVGCQRWAIKQQNARSIGEWRYSELSTGLWHKLALTWPVNERGELIEQFRWPMCGYLMADAPPLRNLEEQPNGESNTRSKLRVLRNGAVDPATAQTVSQMDAKNLMKEFIHCTNVTYRQFEFASFLNTCTATLGLSSAARRLFDADGNEHFDLTNLKQDQLVYITTGEAWTSPNMARQEKEKKSVLASLADDLVRIGYFNKLKNCRNFVLESANSSLKEGNKVLLNYCCLSESQIDRIRQGESVQNVIEVDNDLNKSNDEDVPL